MLLLAFCGPAFILFETPLSRCSMCDL